ncbi:MAG TPA: hypothetical protein VLJ80_14440 [Solirubrobacteraceae bacterium]|nr:hypothetical protein [Solirubrobacteraceae bacterium]
MPESSQFPQQLQYPTQTPFGAPDAGSDVLPRPPFETTELPAQALLATDDGDPVARILVGRMGSGKTRHLIELRDRLAAEGLCDIAPMESDLPSLTNVTRLADDLSTDPVERAEVWSKIWERAIIRSALSWTDANVPSRSIYGEFGRILQEHSTVSQIRSLLRDDSWEQVYDEFEQKMHVRQRPLCFFLDMVEDNSARSPLYWLWCQQGLVSEVLKLSTNSMLADNLRIHVAIRDQTWVELKKRATPILEMHPRVRVLRWDARLILDFLARKLERLPESFFMRGANETEDPKALIAAWLGTATVKNLARGIDEDIALYLLRHTRLIPRDVVTLGNLLTRTTFAARNRGATELADEEIRAAVAESARISAAEELQWCGLEIVSTQLAEKHNRSLSARKKILPDEDAAVRATEQLIQLLRSCEKDVMTIERFRAFGDDAREQFAIHSRFGPLLWRHGLIGWGEDLDGPFRFSLSGSAEAPPDGMEYVALHPFLIDAVGVAPATATPVIPFAQESIV